MSPHNPEILVVPGDESRTELERVVGEVTRVFGGSAAWLEDVQGRDGPAVAQVSAEDVLRRAGEPHVTAVVLPVGSSPSSRFWEVAHRVSAPVVAVPPGARCLPWRRVLLPLDGTTDSSRAVARIVPDLGAAGALLAAVHVVAPGGYPEFCDQVAHHATAWDDEFLRRHLPSGAALEIRRGVPADQVFAELESSSADLVVLGWSQSPEPWRASVVRSVVNGPVPVLLLRTDGST